MLALARLCVAVALKPIAPWAFREPTGTASTPHDHLTQRIARSIDDASRLLPGETLCLPRALAGKGMLWRRGWGSTIRLGVSLKGGLHAHAWLLAGGVVVLGADGMDAYAPVPPVSALVSR